MKTINDCDGLDELLESIQEDYDEMELKKLNTQKDEANYISNMMYNMIENTQRYLSEKFNIKYDK